MIATLSGRLRRKLEDRVIVECGGLGYEVFLPPIAQRQIEHVAAGPGEKGSELELVVYYHATRDQPRPVLIGFTSAGASASTVTSHCRAARQMTPRAWAMSSAVRGNRYSA